MNDSGNQVSQSCHFLGLDKLRLFLPYLTGSLLYLLLESSTVLLKQTLRPMPLGNLHAEGKQIRQRRRKALVFQTPAPGGSDMLRQMTPIILPPM